MFPLLARCRHLPTVWPTALLVLATPLAAAPQALELPGKTRTELGAEVVRIEGRVLTPDGRPGRGAVVVSSAGGLAAAGEDGSFSLEVALAPEGHAVELTAVVSGPRGSLIARRCVDGLHGGSPQDAGTLSLTQTEGCEPEWIPTFGGSPGTNGTIAALAVFDDGSGAGPGLYAAGTFSSAGGVVAHNIARWDGQAWSALASGLNGSVAALVAFDDGSGAGPALYAAGGFTLAGGQGANRIAKWNGGSWSALSSGVDLPIEALTVFDDGTGPALYAGGFFSTAGGHAASRIARWSGWGWSALGSGTNGPVKALTTFDDGSGAALYAGGLFSGAGGHGASKIAKWNGQGWSALGSGVGSFFGHEVLALAVFDDGGSSGPALYAGGNFSGAGGAGASNIAKWDGQVWSALDGGTDGPVHALSVFDDGSGAGRNLYAAGEFTAAGGQSAVRIARWDGLGWSALGGGLSQGVYTTVAYALTVYDDGSGAGPALYAGGAFTVAGGQAANRIAKWDGRTWSVFSTGLDSDVVALTVFDDGSGAGPALYAAGSFTSAGGQSANIARWDGQGWQTLGSGLGTSILDYAVALTVFDDGSGAGPALYAGGYFSSAGGVSANNIARWDGQGWSALGSGLDSIVRSLTVFDDGSGAGPELYAGGWFTLAGGQSAKRIAKWDGQNWSALGSGIDGFANVFALAAFDDGSGAALYAGGDFTIAGGQVAKGVARWDGQGWSEVGDGICGSVEALTVFDDGSGRALYAGGFFTSFAGLCGSCNCGMDANRIAKWDGQTWSALSAGMDNGVWALTVFDEGLGAGPMLYAGGAFTLAGAQSANRIAKWDGQNWGAVGSGMNAQVSALMGYDDGSGTGPALYAGGGFEVSPAGDSYLAKWGCPAIDTGPGCFGNPALLASLSSSAVTGGSFSVSLSASRFASGLGLLFLGSDGTGAGSCGLFVPGIGELLLTLDPMPAQAGSAPLGAGVAGFTLPVPATPSLAGVQVAFQGVALGLFEPGMPVELSNALLVTISK